MTQVMTIRNRIEAIKEKDHPYVDPLYRRTFCQGVDEAAQVAEQADALMDEMASAIEDLRDHGTKATKNESRWAEMRSHNALKRYRQYQRGEI